MSEEAKQVQQTEETEQIPQETPEKSSSQKGRIKFNGFSKGQSKKKKKTVYYVVMCLVITHIVNSIYYYYQMFKVANPAGAWPEHLMNGISEFITFPKMFSAVTGYLSDLSVGNFLVTAFFIACFFLWDIYKGLNKRSQRPGEEYGSARKGDVFEEASQLNSSHNPKAEKRKPEANMILSQNIQIDMDTRHTMLNNNVFVVGGSGSGKTRFYVKPNALQMYCNYAIIDPKGSVAEEIGNAFYEEGYEIRYLNLVNLDKSMGYNPFEYFDEPLDVQKFVNNLIENTKDASAKGGDDFFVKAENTWMCAVIYYIMATCKRTDRCNMNTLMLMLDHSQSREEGSDDFMSEVDVMFKDLEYQLIQKNNGRSEYGYADLAVRNYHIFKMGAGKTAKSILISVGVRLSIFNQDSLRKLLAKDELHLEHFGTPMVKSRNPEFDKDLSHDVDRKSWEIGKKKKFEEEREKGNIIKLEKYEDLPPERLRKVVLFIIISDNEPTLSFLSSIILQQLYTQMYTAADNRADNKLPIHTRIINDEFATSGKQPDYSRKISTMRSREISTSIIVQGISQIKSNSLYGDEWEAIFENCDTTLFLGSKGPSTLDLISKLAGKETDKVVTTSETRGSNASYTRNENLVSRDVYDYSELSRLDISLCLVHIKGHHIYEDKKYDVKNHPNVHLTKDGYDDDIEANKHAFDIVAYAEKSKEIDEGRLRSSYQEMDAVKDVSQYEALSSGEIISSDGNSSILECDTDCYFNEDMMILIEEDMDKEIDVDPDMAMLPGE
ncbi:VirD4-like conjugal transfer protein, CD1115 family [Faecalicoccus acidiformans]|uniref:Type IV secretory system conjugative DNA transfer family protein n=1 Tax=Faecalicoccus acidiformans TaxID=915173 RepID=A0ABS2FNF2_9FIRM|nr:type IV secretory system conjugative DNA transfer family protein [Faecalicoccus acidiformans]MBM6830975.1 type IV secretory system conjugative DNA transfer family protein [Faecalicoccus acidiformans]